MRDDQLTQLLRQIDAPAYPDSEFADRLFETLSRQTSRRSGMRMTLLLVAAVMLIAVLAIGAAVGSGLVKLPWLTVAVTPQPSALPHVTNSPAASPNATSKATASPSLAPTPPPLATSTSATFDLLPAQEPAGFESKIACSGPIGTSDSVALVLMHGAEGEVLRDYADPASPRTVCTFGVFQNVRVRALIDARHALLRTQTQAPTLMPSSTCPRCATTGSSSRAQEAFERSSPCHQGSTRFSG